jgi:hypothetical protein
MTVAPGMRDLARRLLIYEAAANALPAPSEPAALRVYAKLRQGVSECAGIAGFQAFAARALTLAQTEAPGLSAARIAGDGSLQGLGEYGPPMKHDNDQAAESPADEGGLVLIARLLCLLVTFLGEALTLSLLRVAWPGATLDDHHSEHARKA